MNRAELPENPGVYRGASVMRLDERGRPTILIKAFSDTPAAVAFVEELCATGSKAEFRVYETYAYRPFAAA